MSYILAIDQGTTSTTAIIIDSFANLIARHSEEFKQFYPKEAWVEHSATEIKNSVRQTVRSAIAKANINPKEILAIGITNQRETTCLFDKNSQDVHPFVVWQCKRSERICQKKQNLATKLNKITGLMLDPYFSATKLAWIFENFPHIYKKANLGQVLFGTIDSFLAHWLSGGSLHITDATNASRTMLMDLNNLKYSQECLDIFNIPENCLPKITKNIGPFGVTKNLDFLPDGIPIAALIGDQQAALVGQRCLLQGEAKITLGTGSFILQNIGKDSNIKATNFLTSVAYWVEEKPIYCLEASAYIAGAGIKFLRDNLNFFSDSALVDELAESVQNTAGVIFVPALSGLGAPYWNSKARGAFLGLTRSSSKAHMARAVLESIALQNADMLNSMVEKTSNIPDIKLDGGVSKSDLVMQMHADYTGIPCERDDEPEKTAMGAALLAGLAVGIFSSLHDLPNANKKSQVFMPKMDQQERDKKLKTYKKALELISCFTEQ